MEHRDNAAVPDIATCLVEAVWEQSSRASRAQNTDNYPRDAGTAGLTGVVEARS